MNPSIATQDLAVGPAYDQNTPERYRHPYLGLDDQGYEQLRAARVIGEMPIQLRNIALLEATIVISRLCNLNCFHFVDFGRPAFYAFVGMNRVLAKKHKYAGLLLSYGDDLPLALMGNDEVNVAARCKPRT
jgi:hypothetical protein